MGLNSTTMILDRDLSMRSSLLSLPNEVLQKILEFAVHEDQAQAKSRYQAHSFQEFYFNRKANQESAYRIRFVCKRIDGAVVKYLFREVKIRLGWDYLSINPPLRELAEGVMGRVFRENARTLILDQILLQNSPRFEDDRHRDHERNRDLPTEVWYHYPEPMTKEEKTVKYEELKEEVYRMLSVAMVSMSKLVEIRYKSDMQSSAQPLGVAFSSGLSALSNIETLKIQAEIPLHDNRSQKSSLEKHLQAISGLKNLHTLEFSVFSRCNLRIDLDDLWRAMQAANIQLRSLSVDDMSPRLLEYLASFTGLYNLTLSPLPTNHIMGFGDNTQEEMAVFFFNNVTMRHSRTLSHLAIAGKMPCWSINNHNIFALARCQSLTSLAIPFCIMESDLDSDIRTSMELLFEHVQTLPSLHEMTLTLTAAGSFGLHILSMAEASSSVHNTVTNIEYREMSLVPEALTVKYDGGSVEYHLVQVQSSSSAATWRYYAEKPEWLGVSRMFNRRGCVLHTVQRSQKESLRRDQERRDRIAGRISYAAEQRANGTLPGNF